MSGLQHIEYARRELELINTDPAQVDAYLQVIAAFQALEHQDVSAQDSLRTIGCLLRLKPLSELTDDPGEWTLVTRGTWQSRRNAEAFSKDAGKTYTLVSEVQSTKKAPKYDSVRMGESLA